MVALLLLLLAVSVVFNYHLLDRKINTEDINMMFLFYLLVAVLRRSLTLMCCAKVTTLWLPLTHGDGGCWPGDSLSSDGGR